MAEKPRSEAAPQKRSLKLAPLLGDWTTYKPPRVFVKKVKSGLYGFDRLSEDELKLAHRLHYNFALRLSTSLRTGLRLGPEIYSVEALQNTYAAFLKSFNLPVLQGKFKASNYHDEIFVSFDLQLIDTLINASLGTADTVRLNRPLTEAEDIVIDDILEKHLPGASDIFKGVLQDLEFEKIGSPDVKEDQSIAPQSTFVHFAIELNINNTLGKIIFGYSGAFIKTLLKKLIETEKRPPLPLKKLPAAILNADRSLITVALGKTQLSMREIKGLEVGDVVSFESGIDSAIAVALSDGHAIFGQPGKIDGHFAVRIVGVEKEKNVKVAPPSIEMPEKEMPMEEEAPKDDLEKEEELTDEEIKDAELDEFSDEDLEGLLDDDTEEETERTEEEEKEEK